jgi:hypothetical protein
MHSDTTKKNYAAEAVSQAFADYRPSGRRKKRTTSEATIESSETDADDEMSDDDASEKLRARTLKKRIKAAFAEDQEAVTADSETVVPWWAQERKSHNTTKTQPISNYEALGTSENLGYYYNMGIRSQLMLFTLCILLIHSLYNFQYLPDQVQICLRERPSNEWWCETGQAAVTLINEFAKGKNLNPERAFPITSKLELLFKMIFSTLSINLAIVSTLQFLPAILTKHALPPPNQLHFNELDSRRIALLSTVGFWLFTIGITLNIYLYFAHAIIYDGILFTYRHSQENPHANIGRGTDFSEMRWYYAFIACSIIVATFTLCYRFYRINIGIVPQVTADMVRSRLAESTGQAAGKSNHQHMKSD